MRVLHVIEATIGGTRRHIVDVAAGQRAAGCDVHLASSCLRMPPYRQDLERLAAQGVHCIDVPMVREVSWRHDLRHVAELARVVRAVRPDVVHTHSSKGGVLGRLAAQEGGAPAVVHTPHTFAFLFRSMFGPVKRQLYRHIERHLVEATAAVVAVSQSEARTMVSSGVVPAAKVRVVPNGIDPRPWLQAQPLARADLGVPAQAPLALVAGLLNVAKGQDVALRALARPGLERLHLLIVGHGEMLEELQGLARHLRVSERVRFLGWRDDVPALAATCDLLLLPSRWEGMPYIVLEAMAAALPVVATRVDGALELVEPGVTGELSAIEDPDDLARALVRLLERGSAARAAFGEAGRGRLLSTYSQDSMVAGLLRVYAEVS